MLGASPWFNAGQHPPFSDESDVQRSSSPLLPTAIETGVVDDDPPESVKPQLGLLATPLRSSPFQLRLNQLRKFLIVLMLQEMEKLCVRQALNSNRLPLKLII